MPMTHDCMCTALEGDIHVQALHEAEMYYQQLQQDHRAKQDELNGQNNHARSIDRDIRELHRTQGESLFPADA